MSWQTRFNLSIILATAAGILPLAARFGLTFPLADLLMPCLVLAGLGLIGEFYRRKQNEPFAGIISALMQIVA